MATSVNGWPALGSSSRLLHTWDLPAKEKRDDTRLRLRNGSAGFLLIHMAFWFDKKVEDLDEPLLDDWGYAFRPIRGFETTLSNHSSGTAMDLNATDHPLGVVNSFSAKDEQAIHRRLRMYDGCIRWGGDYHNRKDEMHFEINKPMSACERVARRLLDSPRGELILKANPGQKKVILS